MLSRHAQLVDADGVPGKSAPDPARPEIDVDCRYAVFRSFVDVYIVFRIVDLHPVVGCLRVVSGLFQASFGLAPNRGYHEVGGTSINQDFELLPWLSNLDFPEIESSLFLKQQRGPFFLIIKWEILIQW